ncbi:MAG: DoxX family protein [Verrucomicrobiota bacterium]
MKTKTRNIISWVAQATVIVILGQSLFFKFTAHPESVAIFTDLNAEPFGRIAVGIAELITCILLARSLTAPIGALMGAGTMVGAIFGHFTAIGWEGARGELGAMAIAALIASIAVLYLQKDKIPQLLKLIQTSKLKTAAE